MSEFKLSYTANEINEKLGKIDNLAEKKDLPTKTSDLTNDSGFLTKHQSLDGLATETYVQTYAQPVGDYALRNEIPNVESAIIDVVELPTENINEGVFYRLLTAKWVHAGIEVTNGSTVYCVNNLPESGRVVTDVDMSLFIGYYSVTDNEVYGYVDTALGSAFNVPAGWYPFSALAQVAGLGFNGIMTDIDNCPDNGYFGILLSKDYYIYQDGWCKLPFACEKAPEFDITWDGVIGDRFALDMSMLGFDAGTYFVKVSDKVFTSDQLIGATCTESGGAELIIDNGFIDSEIYPGALIVANTIVIVYDSDTLNTALGLPSGYITNGTSFILNDAGYVNRLVAPAKVIPIDEKYIPEISIGVGSINGLHTVAISGNYNDLWNLPSLSSYVTKSELNNYLSKSGGTMTGNLTLNSAPTSELHATTKKYVDKLNDKKLGLMYKKIADSPIYFTSIAYGDGKFVGINNLAAYYSINGINWIKVDLPPHNILRTVTYCDDKFVITSCGSSSIDKLKTLHSIDCVNWTVYDTTINGSSSDVSMNAAYGDGKFVVNMNGSIYCTTNFINWNLCFHRMVASNVPLAYGNGKFVTVVDLGVAAYSTDGINWTECNDYYVHFNGKYMAYGNGKFVLADNHKNSNNGKISKIYCSTDGMNWSIVTLPIEGYWRRITYINGKFVLIDGGISENVVNGDYQTSSNKILYSADGVNWAQSTLPISSDSKNIIYANGKFISISSTKKVCCSTDCIDWTDESDEIYALTKLDSDVTEEVAQIIKPYLNLTAQDVKDIENTSIILTSPNGSRYYLAVDDNGILTTTAIIESTE